VRVGRTNDRPITSRPEPAGRDEEIETAGISELVVLFARLGLSCPEVGQHRCPLFPGLVPLGCPRMPPDFVGRRWSRRDQARPKMTEMLGFLDDDGRNRFGIWRWRQSRANSSPLDRPRVGAAVAIRRPGSEALPNVPCSRFDVLIVSQADLPSNARNGWIVLKKSAFDRSGRSHGPSSSEPG
jgi:hypothetical protein